MKRHTGILAVLILLVSACGPFGVQVREPWPTDPAALAVFLGTWSVEADMRDNNAHGAPAGRYTYVEKYDWRPGEFLLQMDRAGQGPRGGAVSHTLTLGYQVTTGQYALIGTDWMTGVAASGSGTNEGDVWTFHTVAYLGNLRYVHERCRLRVAAQAYTAQCEASPDGKMWSPSYDAKATRS